MHFPLVAAAAAAALFGESRVCWQCHGKSQIQTEIDAEISILFPQRDVVDSEEREENGRKYTLINLLNHEEFGGNITCLLLIPL